MFFPPLPGARWPLHLTLTRSLQAPLPLIHTLPHNPPFPVYAPLLLLPGRLYSSNDTSEQLVLAFVEAVPPPEEQPWLVMHFTYTLEEGLDGFYRSTYLCEWDQYDMMDIHQKGQS
jgi:hypothetical protein